jgi:hypothetical protein
MRVERTDDGFKNMIACGLCGLCGQEFQFGPHRYAGRKVVVWNVIVCDTCDSMNHDGLDPHQHRELMARLKDEGVALQKLPGGFIAIPGRGH